ncbi:MAG: hypothetical protein QHH19_02555 [Candidatus Thermoplasmatota archaeon]|jgi:hypothetical protein|nr:hypothetical protein [Candidatus Thermoplasmatota archaeon]
MEKKKKIVIYLLLSLIVWSVVAIFVIQNPVPKEPDDMPPEVWSYYQGRSPAEVFLIKNRDAILFVLFLFTVLPDVIILIKEVKKQKK